MNRKFLSSILILLFLVTFVVPVHYAEAKPAKVKRAVQLEKQIRRKQRKLQRLLGKLTLGQRAQANSRRVGKSDDSDSDGVIDNYEDSDYRCDDDSDDDGIKDGDELDNGTDPNDDDSDDDGTSDANEVEVKGNLTAFSASELTVGGTTFILDGNTLYRGEDDEILSNSDFAVGECVEVEGNRISESQIVAQEVEKDDDC